MHHVLMLDIHTWCLLISVACLGIYNLLIFWSLRAEILSTLISKVYKLIHMKEQIKKLFNHHEFTSCIFGQIKEKANIFV